MIQTYYGDGKGKTTAACGAALRAAGSGMSVLFISFFKDGSSCECAALKKVGVDLCIPAVGYTLFEQDEARRQARADCYRELLKNIPPAYDMIVLDEALDIAPEHLEEEELCALLLPLAQKSEVVLTGHRLPAKIAEISDYISKITAEKHPYSQGVAARRGIEY